MTEYIRLSKENFLSDKGGCRSKDPLLVIRASGLFVLNRAAVNHIGCISVKHTGVVFCAENSSRDCFAISADESKDAYSLRPLKCGEMSFNNVQLARHIMEKTLQRNPLPAGAVAPKSMIFKIAARPVDDDKNSGVFALIRKK